MPDEWMLIGRVAGAFGVRGEMKVEPLTDFPERFESLKTVYVGGGKQPHDVTGARDHRGQIVLKLAGVESPEAVKALRNPDLFVPRSEAWELPPGHFYLDDVVGMIVETVDGVTVGTVTDVLTTGSNEVFVVNRGADDVLIPVITDAVTSLDMESRRVVIDTWVLTQE